MDQNDGKKRIALLVDYDNFNQDEYFKILFDELDEIGEVIIGRIYFSNEEGKKLSEKFKSIGLEPIYQLRFSKGKNAVDIRMAIEAIELLSKTYINSFCLATHDSDFTPLVRKLKEHNKHLIGAGRDNVSIHFKEACDYFINVEQIAEAKKTKTQKTSPEIKKINKRLEELVKLIDEIIDQNVSKDDYIHLSVVSSQLYIKNKEFNPKNYGASNNKVLPFFRDDLKDFYEVKKDKSVWKIKILPKRKVDKKSQTKVSMKAQAKQIIDNYYITTKNLGNIQKIQQTLDKEIKGFTLKQIGHTRFVNFIKELGYTVNKNTFTKK